MLTDRLFGGRFILGNETACFGGRDTIGPGDGAVGAFLVLGFILILLVGGFGAGGGCGE